MNKKLIIILMCICLTSYSVIAWNYPIDRQIEASDFTTDVFLMQFNNLSLVDQSDNGNVQETFFDPNTFFTIDSGKFGDAMRIYSTTAGYISTFDEVSTYNSIDDLEICKTDDCMISFWYNADTPQDNIFSVNGDTSGDIITFSHYGNPSLRLIQVYATDGSNEILCQFQGTLPMETGENYALYSFYFDRNDSITFYRNGVENATLDTTSDCTTTGDLSIIFDNLDFTTYSDNYFTLGAVYGNRSIDDFVILDGLTEAPTFTANVVPILTGEFNTSLYKSYNDIGFSILVEDSNDDLINVSIIWQNQLGLLSTEQFDDIISGTTINASLSNTLINSEDNISITYQGTDGVDTTDAFESSILINETFACEDRVDNDGDGFIDYPNDLGCTSALEDDELGIVECDDGIDNDGDGLIDYPNDTSCSNSTDNDESTSYDKTYTSNDISNVIIDIFGGVLASFISFAVLIGLIIIISYFGIWKYFKQK